MDLLRNLLMAVLITLLFSIFGVVFDARLVKIAAIRGNNRRTNVIVIIIISTVAVFYKFFFIEQFSWWSFSLLLVLILTIGIHKVDFQDAWRRDVYYSKSKEYYDYSNLSELQEDTDFPIWLPAYIPDNLPFCKGRIADYANGDQNVMLVYSEPGNSRYPKRRSLSIQMTMTDEIISSDSIARQLKVTALDIREIQVRGKAGYAYWTRSVSTGNSAYLVWREEEFNFSLSLSGA
jgi:hypothetical protein